MITVKRDPTIQHESIVTGLMETNSEQMGMAQYNTTGIKQTDVYGVASPILSLNGVVVDMVDLLYFNMDCREIIPKIEFEFRDRNNIFAQYNKPSTSNELQLQILPPIDNAYKKINMSFYITDVEIDNGIVSGEAEYKVPGLINDKSGAFGEISTYQLCDSISTNTGIGFATNVEDTNDKRYIYCDFKNLADLLKEEIEQAGSDESHVYDCWIDPWECLVLCDVYERYNTVDPAEELVIWTADTNNIGGIDDKPQPVKKEAILTNHTIAARTELFVKEYKTITNTQYVKQGTEKAVLVYNMGTREYVGQYVADGDIDKDAYTSLEYGGEMYGEYDYVFAKQCRDMFMKKMKSEMIEVTLTSPVLGLSRGDQCKFVWVDNDPQNKNWQDVLAQAGVVAGDAGDIQTDDMTWLRGWASSVKSSSLDSDSNVNLQVSGQYLIVGIFMEYANNGWEYKLQLARPATRQPQIMVDLSQVDNQQNDNATAIIPDGDSTVPLNYTT